jgi:hypothetical protein
VIGILPISHLIQSCIVDSVTNGKEQIRGRIQKEAEGIAGSVSVRAEVSCCKLMWLL